MAGTLSWGMYSGFVSSPASKKSSSTASKKSSSGSTTSASSVLNFAAAYDFAAASASNKNAMSNYHI